MAILPLQLARVSNLLRSNVSQQAMTRTQQQLLQVQNELSTGKRLNAASDDPGDASIAMQLRKTLEQRLAFADNITHAANHLSEVDSTLGDLTSLLRQAQTIASANVGSDVTASERQSASTVVQSLYNQLLSLGNKQFEGVYLFAGDRATDPPFVETLGGVKFVGSDRTLRNQYDENTILPFMADGSQIFGALSTEVLGTADLTPAVTAQTRLADLRGAGGAGVRLGSIVLGNGSTSAILDLSQADTMQDVLDAINNAGVGGISAAIAPDGNSLLISGGPGDNITVQDPGGGDTAADLGILRPTGGGAGVALDGAALQPRVTGLTRLADLNNGMGVDPAGLQISNGQAAVTIDLSAATTVEDLLNAINGSEAGVLARINAAGTGIDIVNPVQGVSMSIGENGGTTALDLGVRSFSPATALSQLNDGKGVGTVAGADLAITRRDGTSFSVDLDGAMSVQDVIDRINTADGGGGIVASFRPTGNGLRLVDSTGGSGPLSVASTNASTAAADLGLETPANSSTLDGRDVNPIQPRGVFGNLGRLRDALQRSDTLAITAAAEGLRSDLDRVVRVRGQTGARVQELETRQQRLEDENLASKSLLSSLEDTDFNEAVARFQTLQTALQANYQTAGRLLNLSLMDFLS